MAGPSARDDIEPSAGGWKTWVLTSGSQLRLPPPPDQTATAAELQQLRALAARHDAAAVDRIVFWTRARPVTAERHPRAELFKRNLFGAKLAADRTGARRDLRRDHRGVGSKYAYRRPRPVTADPALATAIATPRSPSYPSEHAAVAGAAARVLAYLFPDRADALTAQAEEAARSRELADQYPAIRPPVWSSAERWPTSSSSEPVAMARSCWTGSVPAEAGKWSLARYPAGRRRSGPRSAPTRRRC